MKSLAQKKMLCAALVAMFSVLAGCGSDGALIDPPVTPIVPNLTVKSLQLAPVDRGELETRLRKESIAEMEASVRCYTKPTYSNGPSGSDVGGSNDMAFQAAPVSVQSSDDSAGDQEATATDTNNQEAGVHEGDLIKVRGHLAFIAHGTQLRIVRIWPAAEFGDVAVLDIQEPIAHIHATEDQVIVMSHRPRSAQATTAKTSVYMESDHRPRVLKITQIDVADPTAPTIIRERRIAGRLQASRRIDGRLLLVVQATLGREQSVEAFDATGDDCETRVTEERTRRRAAIETAPVDEWFPKVIFGNDEQAQAISALGAVYANGLTGKQLLAIVSMELDDRADLQVDSIFGAAMTVYASKQGVFVAQSFYGSPVEDWDGEGTVIHGFNIEGAPEYTGSGIVTGKLLNQFSMSEYRGVLRVATTQGDVWRSGNSGSTSAVFTLDATAAGLPQLGVVNGLGRNEKIYAVRFLGDTGYVVTFKKVDPLYVVDLSDPRHPTVAGELKIPGFSTYLHPMEEGKLIGLGKDAEDQGGFAWFQGLKLSLFDVQDPTNPTEAHNIIIGGRGSASIALENHLAFTYDASRGLLALPLTLYEGQSGSGSTQGKFAYSGLHLYYVTPEGGFSLVGAIKDANATNFWSADIERTVILGDAASTGVLVLRRSAIELYRLDEDLVSVGAVQLTAEVI